MKDEKYEIPNLKSTKIIKYCINPDICSKRPSRWTNQDQTFGYNSMIIQRSIQIHGATREIHIEIQSCSCIALQVYWYFY